MTSHEEHGSQPVGQPPAWTYPPPQPPPDVQPFVPPRPMHGHGPPVGPPPAPPPLQHGTAPSPAPQANYGWPGSYGPPQRPPSTSGLAIAALIFGFSSFVLPVIGGVLAATLGIAALVQIRRSGGFKTGTGLAVAGLILGVLTAIGWGLLLTNDDFWDGVREGMEEAQRESATSAVLAIGDCLDMPVQESDSFVVPIDATVPCTSPHTAEYIGSAVLPDSDDYPGEDEVFYQALDQCLDFFVDYTGAELGTYPELDIFIEYPRSLNWRLADREVSCYAINIDGNTTTGSILD